VKRYRFQPEREKKRRAFAAYLALLDAAEWLRFEMSLQLEAFDLSIMQFRVMEILMREGPKHQMEISRRFRSSKQSMGFVIRRLERKGWVRRVPGMLPASRTAESEKIARRERRRGKKIGGRRVIVVSPTADGEKWIASVFPKHAKVVKSYMRALDGRELLTLTRLCEKLRRGDPLRFYKEITRVDFADEELVSGDLGWGGRR